MEEEKKLRPPYASSGQADQTIELLRRITPKKIDSKFVVDNKIATATNAFRIVDFVKWLGICDYEGNVNTEIINKLKLVGEERNKYLAELIKSSYSDIFKNVDLNIAKKDDIINFFISNYRFSYAPAKSAAALFLHLCEKYGIDISEDLKKKTHLSTLKQGERKRRINKSEKVEKQLGIKEEIHRGDVAIINVRGKISANLEAKTQEQLEDILKNQLPKIFEALKLFLPKEKEESNIE